MLNSGGFHKIQFQTMQNFYLHSNNARTNNTSKPLNASQIENGAQTNQSTINGSPEATFHGSKTKWNPSRNISENNRDRSFPNKKRYDSLMRATVTGSSVNPMALVNGKQKS